jgi:cytochrome c2
MKKFFILIILASLTSLYACTVGKNRQSPGEAVPVYIPASKQRSGDEARGFEYLVTGDYVKGGIPYKWYMMGIGGDKNNYLGRSGVNEKIRHDFTAMKAPNGEMIVAPNCLQCHSQVMDGKLFVGLGNSLADFTQNQKLNTGILDKAIKTFAGENSPQYNAAKDFIHITQTIAPGIVPAVRGVNTADRLAAMLVAHRDPLTLRWSDSMLMDIPAAVIPSDVPAWWLLKKKHAMFYNGFGRGDFGRFLMASNLLTVTDSSEAAAVDTHFGDVLSWIQSLQPPAFPYPVDTSKVLAGKSIFEKTCSGCHGTYGTNDQYPNLLIPESIIGTDSFLYRSNFQYPQMVDWFNRSWFSQGDHPAQLTPFRGYIAPPLDGVWITAPYLHNGSVPDLEGVLNSKIRPVYWTRSFTNPVYKYDIPGWQFSTLTKPGGTEVYNTILPGYGNYGHTFGDRLTDAERKQVIEYLKTL